MQCKHCGAEVGSEYRLCPYCKCELEYPTQQNNVPPTIIVQNVIDPNSLQRQNQGYVNPTYPYNNQPYNNGISYQNQGITYSHKSRAVALVLALFLGFWGIHRFYAGKILTGIIWLLTGGFFFIGWIYDIIKIASGTFKDGNNMPIK